MSDWTSGYVADINYTYGYYSELNPLRAEMALSAHGLVSPKIETACELGFGQGISVNLHAAATDVEWFGTDFNPSQAGFAQSLAAMSGAKASLFDEAFEDFCHRSDLPDFDFIGLHGIWSWISDKNRAVIVEFIRKKLKVGGLVYASYNTLPGWAAFAPMRHLMTEHAEVIGSDGRGIVNRINDAIEFADKLLACNPLFARANPLVKERIGKLKEQSRQYLAHEYFNRDWHPMHFATMSQWLEPAKVQYAGSANYHNHIDGINLTPAQQQFLNEVPDRMFRESVRDFMVNQQFRRDYWIKGVRTLSPAERAERLHQQRVILVSPRADIPLKVKGALGEAALKEEIYHPVLDAISDYTPKTLGQIHAALKSHQLGFEKVEEAIRVLIGNGHVAPVQSDTAQQKAMSTAHRFNRALLERSRTSSELSYLASPVTGGAVPVGRFQQWFMLAHSKGLLKPTEMADFAWDVLCAQKQRLMKEGKVVESVEASKAILKEDAETFIKNQYPMLMALKTQ